MAGALLVYLLAALNILPIVGSERITLALVFGIGPVAIVAVLGIHELLRSSPSVFWLRVGTTFLIVAFALLNLMLVVQQMVRLQFRQFRLAAGDASQAALLDAVFKGSNLIQLGIDVSFDVFYCLGVIALSAVMYREPSFGRVLGAFGIVSASALLVFNLATFPFGPADSGLVDLGPVTAIWWLCVIVRIKRNALRDRRASMKPREAWTPPNKELKLTKPGQLRSSQLNSSVRPTSESMRKPRT